MVRERVDPTRTPTRTSSGSCRGAAPYADPVPNPSDPTRATSAVVVGGGPGGLMAADVLATSGLSVTVFERMPSVGRKLLLAGRGGLNLTHSEPLDTLLGRYEDASPALESAIRSFDPAALRAWSAGLGQETFVGTSGRIFPEALRATPLLRAWLGRLEALGVTVRVRHEWTGWTDDGALTFVTTDGTSMTAAPDITVLALGGASWPRVGSNGTWTDIVTGAGIEVSPLRPANGGFVVGWSPTFSNHFAGAPLKNIALALGDRSVRGEALVTATGLEGGAVYALSRPIRDRIEAEGTATVTVDLQPDLDEDRLAERVERRRPKDSQATALRRIGLSPVAIGLLREATANDLPREPQELAKLAKAVPVVLVAPQPIDRAISTAGGIELAELDDRFMLRRRPGTFVAGEMLDWEAPTGGYLLQATFSTAVAAATGALAWLTTP